MKEKNTSKAFLYVLMLILAFVWGLSFIFTKFALEDLSTFEVLAIRWPMAAILFSILILFGIVKVNYKGKSLKRLALVVTCQPCLYAIFEIFGINITTSSESSVIIAMVPMTVCIASSLVLKKKIDRQTLAGIMIAFVGVLFCIIFSPGFSLGGKGFGYLSLIIAVLCGACYTLTTNSIGGEFTPMEITYAMTVGGGIWFTLLSLIMGNGAHPYIVFLSGGHAMWSLLYLGLLCSFMAYLIFNISLVNMPAALATCINTNSINIVGVIAGIIIFDDPWGWYTIAGIVLIIVGIFIACLKDIRSERAMKRTS